LKKIIPDGNEKEPNFCCHAISPDGKWLATGSGEGKSSAVTLWKIPTAKKLLTLSVKEGEILSIAFNRRGDILAAASERALHVWALNEAKAAPAPLPEGEGRNAPAARR
jgi:WD40 repeat protein